MDRVHSTVSGSKVTALFDLSVDAARQSVDQPSSAVGLDLCRSHPRCTLRFSLRCVGTHHFETVVDQGCEPVKYQNYWLRFTKCACCFSVLVGSVEFFFEARGTVKSTSLSHSTFLFFLGCLNRVGVCLGTGCISHLRVGL